MSYAIGYIIYGVPLRGNGILKRALFEVDKQDNPSEYEGQTESEAWESFDEVFLEVAENFFDYAYSGGGCPPYWFGIEIGTLDECSDRLISDIPTAKDEHKIQFIDKLKTLPEVLQEAVLKCKRDTWLLWGSS